MDLSEYKQTDKRYKRRKRVGRGNGSGCGKTCGRGHGGVGARAGRGVAAWFEGGQMPLFRRLPKRGFSNARFRKKVRRKKKTARADAEATG